MQSDSKTHCEGQVFPPPYVKERRFFIVARGPSDARVASEGPRATVTGRFLHARGLLPSPYGDRGMARDRPSPYSDRYLPITRLLALFVVAETTGILLFPPPVPFF